ncbi:PHB depolymerase family esterase [Fulvimarina sp. MAC8]|uniref:extracellular catalytic domain type 1 short-chain-length polyhydroxyalkanoate depolymerase n=1 Tax=Fulvimarina sp. MAC8 TaxID=3162874 RepID=UPI0032ECF36A
MTSLPKIDMQEVTRLTRQGRLDEAMAMLRNETPATTAPSTSSGTAEAPAGSTKVNLDFTGPREDKGGWSISPNRSGASQNRTKASGMRSAGDLSSVFRGFGERFKADHLPQGLRSSPAGPEIVPGARFETHSYSAAAGTREYKLYVPSTVDLAGPPTALIVMLHGCTQSPDDFARGTRMNEIAEQMGFLVVYPGQSKSANMQKCWNWFEVRDQKRDAGEPSLIAGITREVMSAYPVDPSKVFVAGLSAGGAAAAIMGQRYPELYAAVGVHSGLACGAARDMGSAMSAMRGGAPVQAGERVVPTIVFHGDRDTTVSPVNGDHVLTQAKADTASTSFATSGVSEGNMRYTRTVEREADGRERLESWRVHGAGHAWFGGSASGSYTLPTGPDASREMVRFFLSVSS